MIKKSLLLAVAAMMTLQSFADEGMWLPSLISSRIKDMRSKGFRLTAEDIYSINKASMKDAVVLFGRGCTGELVSGEGLLLTNHHCGYGSIQKLSSIDHDYLTYGFWAKSRSEELPCEGLTVDFLVRMEDITDRLAGGEDEAAIVAAAKKEGKGYRASVERMYYGNQTFLFVWQRYEDIRLVGTPPSAIGKFGGDTDNWIWPRHTGDFSVFRIYADSGNAPAQYSPENVPYRPARHFAISTKGVAEGDFTMIYGFPGNTQEYILSDAAEYVADVSDPMKIALRTARLDIISAAQAADPHVRIQYAAKHATIANAWKKWQGEVLGLQRLGTVGKKRGYERRFAAWAADKPQYVHLLDSMRAAYAQVRDGYYAGELYRETIGAIELTAFAARVDALTRAGKVAADAGKGAAESVQSRITALCDAFYKDYDAAIDRAVAKKMLAEFIARMPENGIPSALMSKIAEYGSSDAYMDYVFDNSRYISPETFPTDNPAPTDTGGNGSAGAEGAEVVAVAEGNTTAAMNVAAKSDTVSVGQAAASNDADIDAAHEFFGLFTDVRATARRYAVRNMSDMDVVSRWYKPYLKALREFDPERPFFPDANLTLRVAYGKVAGYEYADGEYHRHFTTLDGVIAKDNPEIYDYDVPQVLRDLYEAKDYGRWGIETPSGRTVPVCFLATNHTTGGNSGSPIINGRGELVGINFDRTWRSTMSDIEFDPSICRNISVDIRYVLFIIEKVGGASYLFDEMTLK